LNSDPKLCHASYTKKKHKNLLTIVQRHNLFTFVTQLHAPREEMTLFVPNHLNHTIQGQNQSKPNNNNNNNNQQTNKHTNKQQQQNKPGLRRDDDVAA
jgi:hypothetical protein